jgi:ABC-type multidrug transport system permease subunit
MTRDFWSVAGAVARRTLRHAFTNPVLLVPSLVFPLLFLVAFAGALSKVSDIPGFHYAPGYTGFQYVFVFLQSAAFGGVFTGFAIATDFETGFARRLLLAAPRRSGILAGYTIAALGRYLFTAVFVTVAGLVGGMEVLGNGVDVLGLLLLGMLLSATATLWGAGVAYRTKTLQAGPFMQIPIFTILFLAPVYVPLGLLKGWIHAVATYNPLTYLMNAGRGFLAGDPVDVALAYACGAALLALMLAWAMRGLRRVERGL